MPKVKVGDINIYSEVHGKREPLMMVMGALGNLEWYYPAIPVYSPKYRLVLHDNRGAGRSDDSEAPYTTEMLADDLAGLLDAIGIESAHILGASLGGMIAQAFTIRYPGRVRSLILAATDCGGVHGVPAGEEYMNFVTGTGRDPAETLEDRREKSMSFVFTSEFMEKSSDIIQQIQGKWMEYPTSPQICEAVTGILRL